MPGDAWNWLKLLYKVSDDDWAEVKRLIRAAERKGYEKGRDDAAEDDYWRDD